MTKILARRSRTLPQPMVALNLMQQLAQLQEHNETTASNYAVENTPAYHFER
jgi:hypothetical protein